MASKPGTQQKHNLWMGLQNLNGNLLCAVDTETTGLDFEKHSVWQICILPLNPMLEPSRDFLPFNMEMRPDDLRDIDPGAMSLTPKKVGELMLKAFPADKVADLLVDWFERLGLPGGKKIVPVAHNFLFDQMMIRKWLGHAMYESIFHFHPRDTMTIGAYLNDRADTNLVDTPYSRLNLKVMCSKHGINIPNHHDAMADCLATSQLYSALCRQHGVL